MSNFHESSRYIAEVRYFDRPNIFLVVINFQYIEIIVQHRPRVRVSFRIIIDY